MKSYWLAAGIIAIVATSPSQAKSGQAAAAPTKPVFSKNLEAPLPPADSHKLESIVDKSPVAPAADPQTQAQTILVMPSAAAMAPVQMLATPEPVVAAAAPQEVPALVKAEPITVTHYGLRDPSSLMMAVIAAFTAIFVSACAYYVYITSANARRQLRAYVFITQTEINGVTDGAQPVAQLMIRNTGQTPAHDVIVYGNIVFEEFPLQKDLPVLVFADPQWTRENIGAGSERSKWEYSLNALTDEQIAKMNAGTHALYIYGEIRYLDVFRKKRSTKYLYFTGGNMGIRGSVLGGYPVGNEAG